MCLVFIQEFGWKDTSYFIIVSKALLVSARVTESARVFLQYLLHALFNGDNKARSSLFRFFIKYVTEEIHAMILKPKSLIWRDWREYPVCELFHLMVFWTYSLLQQLSRRYVMVQILMSKRNNDKDNLTWPALIAAAEYKTLNHVIWLVAFFTKMHLVP